LEKNETLILNGHNDADTRRMAAFYFLALQ